MNISHLEKYSWASMVATAVFLIYYLAMALPFSESTVDDAGEVLAVYMAAVIMFAIVHAVLAIIQHKQTKSTKTEKDERDILIELKGYRIGYLVSVCLIHPLVFMVLISAVLSHASGQSLFLAKPLIMVHVLFVISFISHIAVLVGQLFYYRRGV